MTQPAPQSSAQFLGRKILAVLLGIAASIADGFLTAYLRGGENRWLIIIVFAAVTAPFLIALAWVLLVPTPAADEHGEDTIEQVWYRDASQGALHDLVAAVGLATAALVITNVDISATAVLPIILVFAMLDVVVRYTVAKRRMS
ncbi:hypothetical protein BSZ39_03615 [Bowdeniella nasicola]|uniref:Uncharacterized protein n=1 Tax=Bowdeniella nasicola TaxID=208480 RepID=A0A1Q5Q428_9ACTO|nr:hypothetical protein [Bowdeniella nasicola]OKL54555.1 hypothetical protein BSZ39_03615 [Bowdeniella nasicola]